MTVSHISRTSTSFAIFIRLDKKRPRELFRGVYLLMGAWLKRQL
jgi:hypothetical protein